MSIDDLQAQLRGALDQQLAALKQHYETAIAEARQQAAAEAQRAAELKMLQARADMEAHVEQIASAARAETEQRMREAAAAERQALEEQLRQDFDQQLIERVTVAEGEAERRAQEAATLQWQAREQAVARQLDKDFQLQLEHVIASTKRSAEMHRESERRRAQGELDAERERASAELAAERERAQSELDAAVAAERERVQAQLEGALHAERERLQAAADGALAAERERASAQLNAAFATERDRLQRELDAARAEIEAARQRAHGELEAARQRAQGELDAERQRMLAVRQTEQQQARAEFESELDAVRAEIESELQGVRAELQAERARPAAAPAAGAMNVDGVAAAIRELDDSRTLTHALDAVVQHAGALAGRAALFVIDGDRLKAWKAIGIPQIDAQSVESSIRGRDLLARAIQAGAPAEASQDVPAPPFARLAGGQPALAVPVMIGGRAVAVLYVDSESEAAADAFAAIELIVRHASSVVALRTAMRTLDVLRGVSPENGNGADAGEEQGARRFARLLVSEIKLYNEAAVRTGRQQRDLLQRLGVEIDRARRLYEERVPGSLAARHAYFQQELVQTLADGDPALLGNP